MANSEKPDKPKGKPGNPNWVKGQSGNPGGRPKLLHEVREAARSHSVWGIGRLRELAESEDGRVAIAAIKELLDRGVGRATELDDEERSLQRRIMVARAELLEAQAKSLANQGSAGDVTIVIPPILGDEE